MTSSFDVFRLVDDNDAVKAACCKFIVGRPLWGAWLLKLINEQGVDKAAQCLLKLVELAQTKLGKVDEHENTCAAYLACRLCFAPILCSKAQDFVDHHMAYLVEVNAENRSNPLVLAKYHCEPILREAAAAKMRSSKLTERVVQDLKKCLDYGKLLRPSCGSAGEVSVCCALLITMDKLRDWCYDVVRNNFSRNVDVLHFLSCITGQRDPPIAGKNGLDDYCINFNGFIHLHSINTLSDSIEFVRGLYDRNCALILPSTRYGAKDILIIMRHKRNFNDFAPFYIKVRNSSTKITRDDSFKYFHAMQQAPSEFTVFNNKVRVMMVCAAGFGECDSICEYDTQSSDLLMLTNLYAGFDVDLRWHIGRLCSGQQGSGECSNVMLYGSVGKLVDECLASLDKSTTKDNI